jgi:hypothetical protein
MQFTDGRSRIYAMLCTVHEKTFSFRNLYQNAHLVLWLDMKEYGFPG